MAAEVVATRDRGNPLFRTWVVVSFSEIKNGRHLFVILCEKI